MNWPVWNHRVDKAYEVARTIAMGTHHNDTLHAPTPEVRQLAEHRAEEAIASLRAAETISSQVLDINGLRLLECQRAAVFAVKTLLTLDCRIRSNPDLLPTTQEYSCYE